MFAFILYGCQSGSLTLKEEGIFKLKRKQCG